jgi:uncharacterized membrane protein YccC
VFVWAGYALFRTSYTVFTVCITGYIVLLLHLGHAPGPTTATYRALDTLLGGAIALVAYRVWPTWEASRLHEVIARQSETLARYTDVLLRAYVDPASWDARRLSQARAEARLARSNAEASVERMLGEPAARGRLRAPVALSMLAAFRRYALGALALHAGLDERPLLAVPELAPTREALVGRLHALASALRGDASPPPQPEWYGTPARPAVGDIGDQAELLLESAHTLTELVAADGITEMRSAEGGTRN